MLTHESEILWLRRDILVVAQWLGNVWNALYHPESFIVSHWWSAPFTIFKFVVLQLRRLCTPSWIFLLSPISCRDQSWNLREWIIPYCHRICTGSVCSTAPWWISSSPATWVAFSACSFFIPLSWYFWENKKLFATVTEWKVLGFLRMWNWWLARRYMVVGFINPIFGVFLLMIALKPRHCGIW